MLRFLSWNRFSPSESLRQERGEGQRFFVSLLFLNNLKINIPKGKTFGSFHTNPFKKFSIRCNSFPKVMLLLNNFNKPVVENQYLKRNGKFN